MKFYSTKNKSQLFSLGEVVLKGLPDDNGLFMPENIPVLPGSFFENLRSKSFLEIACEVSSAFLKEDISESNIHQIVREAISFEAPLVILDEKTYVLELFHGPTLAFKDFGARFMARLVAHIIKNDDKKITILVATSGDTGSAVANGFLGVDGIDVVILYPSGKVSKLQELQLTTLGKNIQALEVKGTFDDCQRMVKSAFLDVELTKQIRLTSANSINISRLIPQSFYYFYAFSQVEPEKKVVFSVPSGNFGNLTAGIIACKMGLPVFHFVASTNANKVIPEYLQTGIFKPHAFVQTISNAMDVGNPSNFDRMLDIYHHSKDEMSKDISGFSFNDTDTRNAMKEVLSKYGYVLDPHGAVGILGLKKYLQQHNENIAGIVLETAHPAKFKNVVEETLNVEVDLPHPLRLIAERQKTAKLISNNYSDLKDFLLGN
jgi:threonine synthase